MMHSLGTRRIAHQQGSPSFTMPLSHTPNSHSSIHPIGSKRTHQSPCHGNHQPIGQSLLSGSAPTPTNPTSQAVTLGLTSSLNERAQIHPKLEQNTTSMPNVSSIYSNPVSSTAHTIQRLIQLTSIPSLSP